MPNLQQLNPGTPSLSQQLSSDIGSGVGQGLSYTLQNHLKGKQNKRALSGLAPSLKQSGMSDEDIDSFVNSGLDPKIGSQIVAAHLKKSGKQEADKTAVQGSLNRMLELANSDNLGIRTWPNQWLSDEATGEQAEFESNKASLIAALREKVNKGTFSNQKFDYIVNKLLPKHNDRQSVIKKKLKAIGEQLDLDIPGMEKKEEKGPSKVNPQAAQEPQKLKEGTTFESLPKAADHPNAILSKNGKRYVSDGKTWKEMK